MAAPARFPYALRISVLVFEAWQRRLNAQNHPCHEESCGIYMGTTGWCERDFYPVTRLTSLGFSFE